MPRRKVVAPMQRIDSGEIMQTSSSAKEGKEQHMNGSANGTISKSRKRSLTPQRPAPTPPQAKGTILSLVVCVSGIYASFLTWGLLQERITKTPYTPQPSTFNPSKNDAVEFFKYSIFVNTIQAFFAFISGSTYLLITTQSYTPFPSLASLPPLLLVSLTTTLASPFGYASLAHVDYLTFVLAKSCKLLPVMFLHVTLFNKRYPLSKYLIVLAVTAGVAVFTIYHPPKPGKPSGSKNAQRSSTYGLSLLGINLLFDGLTNTVQDHIFRSPKSYGPIRGPQMMVSNNLIGVVLQALYLLLTPFIPNHLLPPFVSRSSTNELSQALAFISRHPKVLNDILLFCAAGAIGQLFIFATLERFSSLLLVTVTVTRKMLTMVLSVVWYGKSLTVHQWAGVGLVFGGIAAEAWLSQKEKMVRTKPKTT